MNEPALVFDPSLWALNLLSSKSLIDAQNIAISPCGRFVERKIDNVRNMPSRPSAKRLVEDGPLSRHTSAPFQRLIVGDENMEEQPRKLSHQKYNCGHESDHGRQHVAKSKEGGAKGKQRHG